MALDPKKRARPIPNASQRSKKRQKTTPSTSLPKPGQKLLAADEKFIPVAADALPWNEVELPEMHDDAEGFFGLEEIDDVKVIRDGNRVQFVSNKVQPILEDDGEVFEGFGSEGEGKGEGEMSEKQRKAREKRERKRREKKEVVRREMEVKRAKREAAKAGLPYVDAAEVAKSDAVPKTANKTKKEKVPVIDVPKQPTEKSKAKVEKPGKIERKEKVAEPLKETPIDKALDESDAAEDEDDDDDDDDDDDLQVNIFSALEQDTNAQEVDVSAWDSLDLSSEILSQLSRLGFSEPTDIQSESIPLILAGHDVVGKASTGSGKTLAFGIPIVQSWLDARADASGKSKVEEDDVKIPTALILSPTRELATQLADHISALCKGMGDSAPRIARVTGGLSVQKQQRQLALADIIVGTPGRLWDCLSSSIELTKSFKSLKFLVIDEADRLLTEGHFKEVSSILSSLDRQIDNEDDEDIIPTRQTLVFSATFHQGLQQKLAGKGKGGLASKEGSMEYLLKKLNFKEDKPKFIDTNSSSAMTSGLKEGMLECGPLEKDLYLYTLLLHHPTSKILIFTNSIHSVRRLTPLLITLSLPTLGLHSQMPQQSRLRSLERFSSPTHPTRILIATDIAARGLDIANVDLVIHYHLPRTADMYIHRSGRTARGAAATGTSILIVAPGEAQGMRRLLAKVHTSSTASQTSIIKKRYIRSLDIDRRLVARLKPRLDLAKKIADTGIAKEKKGHDDEWLKSAAEELGVDYDSEEFRAEGGERKGKGTGRKMREEEARKRGRGEVAGMKRELEELLSQRINTGVSERYLTGGEVDVGELLRGEGGLFLGGLGGVGLD